MSAQIPSNSLTNLENIDLSNFLKTNFTILKNTTGVDDLLVAIARAKIVIFGEFHTDQSRVLHNRIIQQIYSPNTLVMVEDKAKSDSQCDQLKHIEQEMLKRMKIVGWDSDEQLQAIADHPLCIEQKKLTQQYNADICHLKFSCFQYKRILTESSNIFILDHFRADFEGLKDKKGKDLEEDLKKTTEANDVVRKIVEFEKDALEAQFSAEIARCTREYQARLEVLNKTLASEFLVQRAGDLSERTTVLIQRTLDSVNQFEKIIQIGGRAHFQLPHPEFGTHFPDFAKLAEEGKKAVERFYDALTPYPLIALATNSSKDSPDILDTYFNGPSSLNRYE